MFTESPGIVLLLAVSLECGGEALRNSTYFQSPFYQGTQVSHGSTCSFAVPREPGVCQVCAIVHELRTDGLRCATDGRRNWKYPKLRQIRLDFIEFDLSDPSGGDCRGESFSVEGQNLDSRIPTICGKNSGQHSKWSLRRKHRDSNRCRSNSGASRPYKMIPLFHRLLLHRVSFSVYRCRHCPWSPVLEYSQHFVDRVEVEHPHIQGEREWHWVKPGPPTMISSLEEFPRGIGKL